MIPPQSATEPDLRQCSVVIVLYNSAEVVPACLASLPPEVEVIVVDNASTDDGAARAQAARADAVLISSKRNLGFGAGCNLGWRAAGRPFVAFINPDVRLRATTLAILLRRLADERRSVVGPALLDGSGLARPCKRRPSAVSDLLGLLPAAARWAPAGSDGKVAREDQIHTTGGTVDSVEGACFLLARADLEAIGGFDEDFFLYYEEESLALRLARAGGRAIYEPRAVAEHLGETSTRKVGGMAMHNLHRSRVIFYRKRDGDLRGRFTALVLAAGVLVSAPGAAANTVLGRRGHRTVSDVWHIVRGLCAGMTARLRSDVSYGLRAPG